MTVLFWMIFVALALAYSTLIQKFVKNPFVAAVIAAVGVTMNEQLIALFVDGHLDKFLAIAIIVSFAIAFALSLTFLLAVRLYAARRKTEIC
jgi:hypothetical protein